MLYEVITDGLARRLRRRDDRLGSEIERDAEYVGVLDVEKILLGKGVRVPAQRPANHLLGEQRGAEGTFSRTIAMISAGRFLSQPP